MFCPSTSCRAWESFCSRVMHNVRGLTTYLSLSTAGTLLMCCSSTSFRTSASNSASCSLCSRLRSWSICRQQRHISALACRAEIIIPWECLERDAVHV